MDYPEKLSREYTGSGLEGGRHSSITSLAPVQASVARYIVLNQR